MLAAFLLSCVLSELAATSCAAVADEISAMPSCHKACTAHHEPLPDDVLRHPEDYDYQEPYKHLKGNYAQQSIQASINKGNDMIVHPESYLEMPPHAAVAGSASDAQLPPGLFPQNRTLITFADAESVVAKAGSDDEGNGRRLDEIGPDDLDCRSRGPPKERIPKNDNPEVGNFGIFCGNWGEYPRNPRQGLIRDRQIRRNPGNVLVLTEATDEDEKGLRKDPLEGEHVTAKLQQGHIRTRGSHKYFTIKTDEEKGAVLIACRQDTCSSLDQLHARINHDHKKESGITDARSRFLVGKVTFKQGIGHLGKDIVVCGVHGHYTTMKIRWRAVWEGFFDYLAWLIIEYNVKFLAGDFNMSFTEVPKHLGSQAFPP